MSEPCDWFPAENRNATTDDPWHADAVLSVGRKRNWHLCAACAALPAFAKMTYRKPLKAAVPDVEATLRAENATLRESLERALVCLYGADATLDDARKVPTVDATLRAQLGVARAEVARLTEELSERLLARDVDMTRLASELTALQEESEDRERESGEVARLRAEVKRLTALYRKADDGHDENMRETARLIGEVERLTAREPGGLDALRAELTHARRKFPGGARLIEALCEELGEAAREERPDAAGNREWLQVACVAMRLYEEGCPDAATSPLLPALRALEAPARAVLVESGND